MSDLVLWQAGGVFLISLVLFLWGASAKGITLDRETWKDMLVTAAAFAFLFAAFTDWQGFRPPGSSLPPNLY